MPGISDFPPRTKTVSCALGAGASPFVPTAVIRSPSTTTVALRFGLWIPSTRFAPRKKIRPMVDTSAIGASDSRPGLAPYLTRCQCCQMKVRLARKHPSRPCHPEPQAKDLVREAHGIAVGVLPSLGQAITHSPHSTAGAP